MRRVVTSNIAVTVDDEEVMALIDTGADTSVMSMGLACRLKKVSTQWAGSQIRTAGGHLLTPVGRCTARVSIHGFTYLGDFIILPSCSRDLILGLDFLRDNGAVIDLQQSQVTFSTAHALARNPHGSYVNALRIVDDDVTLPPKSSVLTLVTCDVFDKFHEYEGIAEANIPLLLKRNICIARCLVRLENKRSRVLLNNFSNDF